MIRSAPVQPPHSLLPWGLTACAVVAGPALFGAQATPDVTLAAVTIALTVLLIGVALWPRKQPILVGAPVRRPVRRLGRTLGLSSP
jgi:hypothetical protein